MSMGTITLRLPESLHERVRKLAEKEHVSINQLITLALTEKVSVLLADKYLKARAKRASRRQFTKAMAKVADIEPDEDDRL